MQPRCCATNCSRTPCHHGGSGARDIAGEECFTSSALQSWPINSNAQFVFVDPSTGALAAGTVFTVIDNTSASPISGQFSNLADGLVFASNGTSFKVSYTGGTGNDLTLTVQ